MPSTTSYKRGDVVLVPFPFTDLSTTKQRPALVVSSDQFNATRNDVLVAAITSQKAPLLLRLVVAQPASALDLRSVQTRGHPNGVTVTFSAPVSALTATNPANYAVSPGVTLNSVTLIEAAKVRLYTTPIAEARFTRSRSTTFKTTQIQQAPLRQTPSGYSSRLRASSLAASFATFPGRSSPT